MRANYKMQRLYVTDSLAAGKRAETGPEAVNYLSNVLRMKDGDEILVFNGRDGEWRAALRFESRKKLSLEPLEQTRQQPAAPDLLYCFALLKQGRLDYLVQKAVEMGAGVLQPVITQHTQVSRIGTERIEANVIEAAEQCGVLAIPQTREPAKLEKLLEGWDNRRHLIFCDEGHDTHNPLPLLQSLPRARLACSSARKAAFPTRNAKPCESCPLSPLFHWVRASCAQIQPPLRPSP